MLYATMCAVSSCETPVRDGHAFCDIHWTCLPHKVRVRVNMAYSVDRGSAEHRAAIAEAVRLVQERLANEAAAMPAEGEQ